LNKLSFFQRIPPKTIEAYIRKDKLEVRKHEYGELLQISGFTTADTNVYVMLDGKVSVRDHRQDRPLDYNLMQTASKGDILGAPDLDMGNSTMPHVWSIVQTTTAHAVKMSR
jgi:hypothetical protein